MNTKKKVNDIKNLLGTLDVVFIIDTTASMWPYITEAKNKAVEILKTLQVDKDLDVKVALIEYRDHPPQDISFVTRKYDFDSLDEFQTVLNSLSAQGGGDRPEAVWPAIKELESLQWRENSERMVYLIGDSPPHGYTELFSGDAWPQGDPSGITDAELVELLQKLNIKLNAHSIANYQDTTKAFTILTDATEGDISVGDAAEDSTTLYTTTLNSSADLINDSRMLYANAIGMSTSGTYTADSAIAAANSLGWDEAKTRSTVAYLNRRKITE